MKLSMKNKKEELYLGYFEAQEKVEEQQQQMKVLFGVCAVLFCLNFIW